MKSSALQGIFLTALGNRKKLERIAQEYNGPVYVTYLDALGRHGLITDVPDALQCATLGDSTMLETPHGTIEFYNLPEDFFFGYHKKGNLLPIAEPEKSLIDALMLSEQEGIIPAWLENLDWRGLDLKKLNQYAERMGISNLYEYLSYSRVS